MRAMTMKNAISQIARILAPIVLVFSLAATAHAATPGISAGTGATATFNLTAQEAYLNQPDGQAVYSWGYGCATGFSPTFLPSAIAQPAGGCPTMQVPGPTLIVTEGQTVTVHLLTNLPSAAGSTSILFPGFNVTATGGIAGLLTQEATPTTGTTCTAGSTSCVTYTFTASSPGTPSM